MKNNDKKKESNIEDIGGDFKRCQNCKYYDFKNNSCGHIYWNVCIVRNEDGYVTQYRHHNYR